MGLWNWLLGHEGDQEEHRRDRLRELEGERPPGHLGLGDDPGEDELVPARGDQQERPVRGAGPGDERDTAGEFGPMALEAAKALPEDEA